MKTTAQMTDFPSLLQRFFCEYLANQRDASPDTIASYRDAFRLLLRFSEQRLGKAAASLTLSDLDAPHILAFLDSLEMKRRNSARSRNLRLAAIRSFLNYAASQEPRLLDSIQRVLAIPRKRFDRIALKYLLRDEMTALLDAPKTTAWSGRRDRVMFLTMYNTAARASEVLGLDVDSFRPGRTATLRIRGKGRKERVLPLWRNTSRELAKWIQQLGAAAESPLFPSRRGERLTRSGIRTRLDVATTIARKTCLSLRNRRVSPHVLRHTTAMHLLQSGVDITVIALWLGHESTATTHMYVEADLAMKRRAIDSVEQPDRARRRHQPSDRLLAFLDGL